VLLAVVLTIALSAPPRDEIAAGVAAVRAAMKDPGAAQFRGVALYADGEGAHVVCGEVNGRNSFGGFNGFEEFVVDLDLQRVKMRRNAGVDGVDEETWREIYSRSCKTKLRE
jgi:hypothetical protein